MKIGDRVIVAKINGMRKGSSLAEFIGKRGKLVHITPASRSYVVEFPEPDGKFSYDDFYHNEIKIDKEYQV